MKLGSLINNHIKKNYIWICSIVISFIFLLCFMLFLGVAPFGNKSFVNEDAFHQIYSFMAVLQRKLKNGESLLYYWNNGA